MRMKKYIDVTTVKFLIVGLLNTIVGTAIMFLCYNCLNLGYWFSTASNYIVGSIVSYFLNKYFTFQNRDKSVRQIVYFILNISICYFIAYGLAKPLIRGLLTGFNEKIQNNIAMMVGMGLFIILNYFGQRLFVFRKEKEKDGE